MTLTLDERRGHIHMSIPNRHADRTDPAEVIGAELGDTLQLSTSYALLTAVEARELARALVWWADRRQRLNTAAAEADDVSLLDLLEET